MIYRKNFHNPFKVSVVTQNHLLDHKHQNQKINAYIILEINAKQKLEKTEATLEKEIF